jgi:TolB-like protein/Tfp pilus assembly protein PilF
MSLFAELRRRNVIRMAGLYLLGAWVFVQVAETVLPTFDVPTLVLRAIIIVIALGFIPALVFAWVFELTPEGLRRDDDVDPSRSIAPQTGRRMDRVIIALLVLALGYFAVDKFALTPRREAKTSAQPSPASQGSPSAGAVRPENAEPIVAPVPGKSIAVLPFENLSGDKDNEYFASGMQDMILTKLAAIGDLKVISRTSTEKYSSHPDNLKTIAQQLGVATVLEGSVQKAGNSVLINVQLIDAGSDVHLWAEAYPRTLDNIFGVEGEVAQKVADALKAKLSPAETASVASVPTQSAEAYDAFLKGEFKAERAQESWQAQDYAAADAEFQRAIERDPGFALAYAARALNQLNRHWFNGALPDREMAAVKASIDRALALKPDLPNAHLALAYYYYWGFRRYEEATREFERVRELAPNSFEAIEGFGNIARRTGRALQAATYYEQALALSPRDTTANTAVGETYTLLRRYDEGGRFLKRALAISAADANSKDLLVQNRLFGFGDVAGAREVLLNPPDWRITNVDLWGGDVLYLINVRAYPDFFERRFPEALRAWDGAPTGTDFERLAGRVARVVIEIVAGHAASQKAECAQLAPLIEAELARRPASLGAIQQLAWVEVCLGRNTHAIATARKALGVLPLSKDSYFGGYEVIGLAQVAAHAGAPDVALDQIRQLLAMPAGTIMSVERLRLDPIWDPLRKDPRFEALLAGEGARP